MALELPELVQQDLGQPKRTKRDEYWWLCPFHQEDDASLQVDYYAKRGKWRWKCWGCGKEGDALDWLVASRGMSTGDAWRLLNGDSAPPVQATPTAPAFHYGEEPAPAEWQDAALDACLVAAATLRARTGRANGAWKWLLARGLRPATIERAMLGYNASWLEVLPGHWLPPGITIPSLTNEALWYVNVRLSSEEGTKRGRKYMSLAGSRLASLYQAEQTLGAPVALAVEGEFDALLASQFFGSDELAVVTMGSATTSPSTRWKRYLAWLDKLLVVLDEDDAGRRGMERWRSAVQWLEPVRPPEAPGKDVTDWWKAGVNLREWLEPYLATPAPDKVRADAILRRTLAQNALQEANASQLVLEVA